MPGNELQIDKYTLVVKHTRLERARPPQVYSVNWNIVQRNLFLSGSWDDSIKLWDLANPGSLRTFKEHTYCVYAAVWCSSNHHQINQINSKSRVCNLIIGIGVAYTSLHL